MIKTIEERVAALETATSDEVMKARITAVIAEHSEAIVRVGIGQVVRGMGRTLISPFTWLFSRGDEPEVATAAPAATEPAPAAQPV